MRWPFRRGAGEAPPGTTHSSAPPPPAPAAPADAWRRLPALQRVSADLAPVAPLDRFAGSLSTHQDPRFLAPLAHALTPDAPSGEVTGLAQPVAEPAPSHHDFATPPVAAAPAHLDVPVQRHPAEPAAAPPRSGTTDATPPVLVVPLQRVTGEPTSHTALPAVEPRPVPALPDVVVSRTV